MTGIVEQKEEILGRYFSNETNSPVLRHSEPRGPIFSRVLLGSL